MWKHLVVYESRPYNIIVTFIGQPYKVPEVVLNIEISLISTKPCQKVIS
jgi:hypothetical protein